MNTGVAHHAFQLLGCLKQLTNLTVFFNRLAQLRRVLNRLLQRNVELGWHHFGDTIDVGIRDVHGAAHVFDRGLGSHGAKGDDLGNVVASVFLGDVVDDFAAPVHAEVDVDIGHRHALGIQKALKQQLVLQRVDIGNAERVRDQRSSG